MFANTRRLFAGALIAIAVLPARDSQAQVQDFYAFVRADWHLAGIAEYQNDWNGAIGYYRQAVTHSDPLPLVVREWYRGTAAYGIARCYSRMQHDSAARASLAVAYRHHFWNTALIRIDSSLIASCGQRWLDSIATFWSGVRTEEQPTWSHQPTLVYYPDGYDSTARWPLVIAMHGGNGNYESFAERWPEIAKQLKAIIIVPPGIIRESEITNSWGSNMTQIEGPIIAEARRFTDAHLADPSQVYLTGFSQGGQASIELTLRHPDIFKGAIAMSGFSSDPPTDSALRTIRSHGTRIYAISGQFEDPTFHAEIVEIHDLCVKNSIPFQLNIVPGMIHEVPLDLESKFLEAWTWLRQPMSAQQARAK